MELGTTKFPLIGRQICLTEHKSIKAEQNVISSSVSFAQRIFPRFTRQQSASFLRSDIMSITYKLHYLIQEWVEHEQTK